MAISNSTQNMTDRWNARQESKREALGDYSAARTARLARGEYLPGDRVNGYILTTKGVWQSAKRPFSNLANWLALASLLFLPLALVALVLAAVGQSKNEAGADSAMTFAAIMGVFSVGLFILLIST